MIAADTSSWIGYSKGVNSQGVKSLEAALEQGNLVIPPVVLVEILSGPSISREVEAFILMIPCLEISPGYWERAGRMRRAILKLGNKARLGDCLIAQSCIDREIALISEDRDFKLFTKFGLKILGV